MAIDIDNFLNRFREAEQRDDNIEEDDNSIDLNFQKDVEDKIARLQNEMTDKDFTLLFKAYEEIKKFDEDLPRKLFGINEKSSQALGEIGSKYSDHFLIGVRANVDKHTQSIRNHINEIDKKLKENNFQEAITIYNVALNEYKMFPEEFMSEKIEVGRDLRTREVTINEKFELFRIDEVKNIKDKIAKTISDLKLEMIPGNIQKVESLVGNMNYVLDKAPKVFFGEILKERIAATKAIVAAEDYLKKEYLREFEEKSALLHHMFEKYHKYHLKKDVDNALAIYDEIIIMFANIPEVFLDKKVELYKQISKIFESLNGLLMSSNVTRFLETYNNSKILNEAREYVAYAKRTKRADLSNLIGMRAKLKQIPMSLKLERVEVETELENLIADMQANGSSYQNTNLNPDEKQRETPYFKDGSPNIETGVMNDAGINVANAAQKETSEEFVNPQQTNPNIQRTAAPKEQNAPPVDENDPVSKGLLDEINSYYEKLKSSSDKNEIAIIYKKIMFYLDTANLKEETKTEIKNRVNKVLSSKKLS